jgi:hypothetical protein
MRTLPLLLALALVSCVSDPPAKPPASSHAASRVGVFERAPVLVAYYQSPVHAARLARLEQERDEALARGDRDAAAAVEARGAREQELAHARLAGEAPLGEVLAAIESALPRIASEARVDVIVERPLWRAPRCELVDVTDAIVASYARAR